MRLSSFIVGGIIGAAITIYMNRNNNTMMQTFSDAGQFVNSLMNTEENEQSASIFDETEEDTSSSYHVQ